MKPESGFFLSNPFKPSGFGSIFSKCFFCWRPRRDLNPCYRRERAVSWAGLDDGDAWCVEVASDCRTL